MLPFTRIAVPLGILIAAVTSPRAETDTLPALTQFSATAGKLAVTLTMRQAAGPVTIGRDGSGNSILVDGLHTLTVCNPSIPLTCADPYAGAVLKLSGGETLKATLANELGGSGGAMKSLCMDETGAWSNTTGWSSVGGLFNEHYHGLLTPPVEGKAGVAGKPFGDFIFTCTSGTGITAVREYSITLPLNHPKGIDWFHPHVHGIAKPQVASGMAGMILVGDLPCVSDSTAPCSVVRPIMLKDIQLVKVPGSTGDHWVNFADQEPGFCGDPPFSADNLGSCPLALGTTLSTAGADLSPQPQEGRWVFTLNGMQYPTMVVGPAQVWRVQNASANITYRLSLRRLGAPDGQVVADAPFEILSLDGAGLAGVAGTDLAPQTREILLMPGSRADLRVTRPLDGGAGELAYQLVNEAFQAGFALGDADVWPHVALARVIFAEPQPIVVDAAPGPGPSVAPAPEGTNMRANRRTAGRPAEATRLRVAVDAVPAAALRASPLGRGTAQLAAAPTTDDEIAAPTLPLPEPQATVSSAGVTGPSHAGHSMSAAGGAGPQAPGTMAMAMASERALPIFDDPRFRISRWLREYCDGPGSTDGLAQVDALLPSVVLTHQPITNDAERRQRYWTHLHFDPRTTHRRIYFGIQTAGGDERFVMGETLVRAERPPQEPGLVEMDHWGRPISPSNPVVLTTFNAEKGLCILKRKLNQADPLASVEQWELVNVSREVHNFHIHQMKFVVARDANGQTVMRTPSSIDQVQLPAVDPASTTSVLQHDTIVVPRGQSSCETSLTPIGSVTVGTAPATTDTVWAFLLDRSAANSSCTGLDRSQRRAAEQATALPDGSGMIVVNLSFTGDWLSARKDGNNVTQPARFVFHCHILEHEDRGMMHRITVLEPN